MTIRVTQSMLALLLVLGCTVAQTAAQNPGAAQSRLSLWSVLNLPTLDGTSKPTVRNPASRSMPPTERSMPPAEQRFPTLAKAVQQETPSAPIPLPANEPKPAKRPLEPEPETATASLFSPSNSSRRSVFQKRELADEKSAPRAPDLNLPSPTPVTPHWTPKFAVQHAVFQLSDEELVRPVAVNMAGDLISDRATAARAVKRLDPTLRITPSMIKTKLQQPSPDDAADAEKSASAELDPGVQLATASPAAAR